MISRFSGRRIAAALLAAVAASALSLSAASANEVTGSAAKTVGSAKPGRPIIEVYTEGGFVAPAWTVSRLPEALVYADGTVITPASAPRHSYVRQALVGTVPEGRVADWTKSLQKLTKTPQGGWGFPGVADVPNTRVKVNLPGVRLNVSVYALSFTNGLAPVQAKARLALARQLAALKPAKSKPFQASAYEVWGQVALLVKQGAGVGVPNPAAVFCQSVGGVSAIVETSAGQAGTCQLGDSKPVDEWKLYRAALATLPSWPAHYSIPEPKQDQPGGKCMVIAAASVKRQLGMTPDAQFEGRWLLPSGQAFPVILRPVLPGETGCQRVQ